MPCLSQLLRNHAPLLLIDAASTRIQVGLFSGNKDTRWLVSDDEAGVAIFQGIARLGADFTDIRGFAYCEGPGSILGIRTSAMAIRTWQMLAPRPAFAYGSLALVSVALGRPDLTVIADARRDTWHVQQPGRDLRRAQTSELSGELAMPENFRHWSPLPPTLTRTPYNVGELLARVPTAELFREVADPDAFLHQEPSYAAWTPHIHRPPTNG